MLQPEPTLSSGDNTNPGVLDVGETWIYTATYDVTQDDINAGDDLVNTATVDTDQTDPEDAEATTSVSQDAELTIEKDVNIDEISAPGTLTYTITAENTGSVSLTNVVLTDPFATTGPTLSSGDNTNPGVLDVGETWIYTATYDVTQDDINAGDDLVNTATVDTDQTDPEDDDATTSVSQDAELTIEKYVNIDEISAPGTLTYTITVENTGSVSLTNVVLTDPFATTGPTLSSGDITNPGVLDVDETWIYTATYDVTQDDINAGDDLVNTATVDTDQTDPEEADATTSVSQDAELTIEKDVNIDEISAPGTLTYTITVENTGSVSLTNVVLTDPFATTGPILTSGDIANTGVLDVGETWTYTATYNVTQDDIDDGVDLVNTATVDTDQTDPEDDDATTTIEGTSDLDVTKTVDRSSISAPVTLNYTITVTNTGTVGLTGIRVVDAFAGGAVYVSGDTDRDNVLDLTETWIYTADYTATQANIDTGSNLVNIVSVTSNEVTNPVTAQAVTTIAGDASLTVEKTQISTDPITAAGQVITYRIIIRNTGNISLTGCVATEIYPGTGRGTLSPVIESISPNRILNVGETWTHTATYTVTQTDIDRGTDLVNTISIFANEYPGPTEDTETTPVAGTPSLTVIKTQTSTAPVTTPGQVITYQISVRNTGSISITGVNPTEIYPGNGPGTLSPPAESISSNGILNVNETWTYTATYTVTQDDLDNNESLTNTIEIRTPEVPGPTTDTEVTLLTRRPAISITKATTATTFTAPGEVISYTLIISNTGNVTLTGVVVTDPIAVVTCTGAPYTLVPGEQVTCTAVHTVTARMWLLAI